jgi:hypothetical protein
MPTAIGWPKPIRRAISPPARTAVVTAPKRAASPWPLRGRGGAGPLPDGVRYEAAASSASDHRVSPSENSGTSSPCSGTSSARITGRARSA